MSFQQLKIHFDDSLTRTFEYPSEASLIEDSTTPAISPLGKCYIILCSIVHLKKKYIQSVKVKNSLLNFHFDRFQHARKTLISLSHFPCRTLHIR